MFSVSKAGTQVFLSCYIYFKIRVACVCRILYRSTNNEILPYKTVILTYVISLGIFSQGNYVFSNNKTDDTFLHVIH